MSQTPVLGLREHGITQQRALLLLFDPPHLLCQSVLEYVPVDGKALRRRLHELVLRCCRLWQLRQQGGLEVPDVRGLYKFE